MKRDLQEYISGIILPEVMGISLTLICEMTITPLQSEKVWQSVEFGDERYYRCIDYAIIKITESCPFSVPGSAGSQ